MPKSATEEIKQAECEPLALKPAQCDLDWLSDCSDGLFTVQQSQVRITQVVDTHLIEFKFQDGFHAQALTHELADGIAQS